MGFVLHGRVENLDGGAFAGICRQNTPNDDHVQNCSLANLLVLSQVSSRCAVCCLSLLFTEFIKENNTRISLPPIVEQYSLCHLAQMYEGEGTSLVK